MGEARMKKRFNFNIIILIVLLLPIAYVGSGLLLNLSGESKLSNLPKSRVILDVKSSVLKSALSDCEWCEVDLNTRYMTIKSTNLATFMKVVNNDNLAKVSAESFPDIYSWEESGNSAQLTIKRDYRLLTGGTIPVPTWLIYSLLKNDVLIITE